MSELPEESASSREESDATGLPLLRTWSAVYTVVLIIFVCVVVALWLFTRAYS